MNTKQLLAAAGLIIILAIIYLISASGRSVQKSVDTDAFMVDSNSVAFLTIQSKADTFTFTRNNNNWQLENYKVDKKRFKSLFETFTNLVADRFVSKNKSNYRKYGVDSLATKVIFKNTSGKTLKSILLGNTSSSGNETFLRSVDSKKVYTIVKNLNSYKNITLGNYWDKEIIRLKPEDIFTIQMEGDFKYNLEQKNMGWTFDGQMIDMEKGNQFINKMVDMEASKVSKGRVPATAMLKATATITPRNGKPAIIKFYENDDKSTTVYVTIAGNPMRFEIYKSTFEGFNKKFEDLKPKEVEKPAESTIPNN